MQRDWAAVQDAELGRCAKFINRQKDEMETLKKQCYERCEEMRETGEDRVEAVREVFEERVAELDAEIEENEEEIETLKHNALDLEDKLLAAKGL